MSCRLEIFSKYISAIFLIFVGQLICIKSPAIADSALTYQAHQYLEIELSVEDAFRNQTIHTLNKFLSKEFSVHRPSQPSLGRQELLKIRSAEPHQEWLIRDVEVQTFDGISIVSFTRVNATSKEQLFIVDIWKDSLKKLQSRYEVSAPSVVPQTIPPKEPFTKEQIRPNGRG